MRAMSLVVPVLALAALVGCDGDSRRSIVSPQLDVAEPASGPSISGHGNWINPAGEYVSRSFHARVMPDGSVQGEFVQWVTALNGDRRPNKGDLNCLRFIAPNDAVVSGPILVNNNPDLIGQTQIFRVRDDGEGSDAVDRMSSVFFRQPSTGLDCQTLTPPESNMLPLEGGNLQVRP
jgi:hypothetical protein